MGLRLRLAGACLNKYIHFYRWFSRSQVILIHVIKGPRYALWLSGRVLDSRTEFLTRERRVASSSLTGGTALCT